MLFMSTYRRKVIARISSKAHKVCQFPDNIAGSHKAGQLGTSLHLRICSVDQLPISLSNIPGLPGWNRGSGGTDLHLVCVCVWRGVVIPLSNNFCSDEGKYPFWQSTQHGGPFTFLLAHQSSRFNLNRHYHDIFCPRVRKEGGKNTTYHLEKEVPSWTS